MADAESRGPGEEGEVIRTVGMVTGFEEWKKAIDRLWNAQDFMLKVNVRPKTRGSRLALARSVERMGEVDARHRLDVESVGDQAVHA
jgi:hypothetical protein